jgi:IS30 family transposase
MGKRGPKAPAPYKSINWEDFEKLCGLHCTLVEIAKFFNVSEDTVERHVRRHYGENFAEVFKRESSTGKISLRRKMYKAAIEDGNITMMIWLSKNQLGMSDKVEQRNEQHVVAEVASKVTVAEMTNQQIKERLAKIRADV